MTGTINVIVTSSKDKFTLKFKRKFTVIRGESGTGKTLLSILINEYVDHRKGVNVYSDIPVLVAHDYNALVGIVSSKKPAVVVLDEDSVSNLVNIDGMRKFMELASGSELYFLLITRLDIPAIPYSCNEVYNMVEKYVSDNFTEHEMENAYEWIDEEPAEVDKFITEDEKSGYQFFQTVLGDCVVSARGNSNVIPKMKRYIKEAGVKTVFIMADSAAFGAFIGSLIDYKKTYKVEFGADIRLLLPESFEYLLLNSSVCKGVVDKDILINTQDYCDSAKYDSWEQFYTDYLVEITEQKYGEYGKYTKSKIKSLYITDANIESVFEFIKEIVR